jgi:hypothetical protein
MPNRSRHAGAGVLMLVTTMRRPVRRTRMLADSPRAVSGADSQNPGRDGRASALGATVVDISTADTPATARSEPARAKGRRV